MIILMIIAQNIDLDKKFAKSACKNENKMIIYHYGVCKNENKNKRWE